MKVLTFYAYYEPEIVASMYIVTNLLEDMALKGIDVEAFVPTPTRGVDNETIKEYKKKKLETKLDDRLKIHRFAMIQEGKNIIGRALRYIILNLAFFIKGLSMKADVIFIDSTPPTNGVIAALLKKIKNIPMVYNLQDIFPDSLVHTRLCSEKSVFLKIGTAIENITYKNSDKIIVISEDFKRNIIAKGVPEGKIEVIYNWVDEQAVVKVTRENNKMFDKYKLDRKKFYITHCGNIGFTQNMDLMLKVAKELESNKNIIFILIGDGAYKIEVNRQIAKNNISNVVLLPFQPYEDISNVFSLGDVGLVISKPGIGNNSVPSKTWSIMSAECPVLASFDKGSELDVVISENNCGKCVEADNIEELKEAIVELYCDSYGRDVMGKNGRNFVLNNLTRKISTEKYINVIEKQEREFLK